MKTVMIILITIMIYCMIPSVLNWIGCFLNFRRRNKNLYEQYLNRLSDYEEYHCFMELCERKHQVKVINAMIDRGKEMRRELFH